MKIDERFAVGYIAKHPSRDVYNYVTDSGFYTDSLHSARILDSKEQAIRWISWLCEYKPMFNQEEVSVISISTNVRLLKTK